MNFDLIIIDVTTPHPYEQHTLEVQGVGGTEASVIRVAEGLGKLGLKVAVLEHNLKLPLMGANACYLPIEFDDQNNFVVRLQINGEHRIEKIDADNVIALRGCQYLERFPKARKFSWHEDVPNEVMVRLRNTILEHDVTVVAASKWHKSAIQDLICDRDQKHNPRVTYVYNPVPDELYVPKDKEVKYYPNKLVWLSSPHKGLDNAINIFHRLIDVSGNKDYRLHIFNPGYFGAEATNSPYVINHGSVPCKEIWQHASESLCVFYPTTFKETFGCIAAEANAVHTPVLTHEIAALAETVSGHGQFVKNCPRAIIDTVIKWNKGERPKVYGNNKFRTSEVCKQWLKLINGKNTQTQ